MSKSWDYTYTTACSSASASNIGTSEFEIGSVKPGTDESHCNSCDDRCESVFSVGHPGPPNLNKQLFDKESDYEIQLKPNKPLSLKEIVGQISQMAYQIDSLLNSELDVTSRGHHKTAAFFTRAKSIVSPHTRPQSITSSFIAYGPDKDHDVLYKITTKDKTLNSILNALMYIKETPSTLRISEHDLKNIIFNETIHCNLLLAVVGGLPSCGKSKVIHRLLSQNTILVPADINFDLSKFSLQNYVEHGLSSYRVTIVGRKPFDNLIWMPEAKSSMNLFSCASVILHNSLLQGQEVELVDIGVEHEEKSFKSAPVNDHLHQVYEDVDVLLRQGDFNHEIRRILPSGITAVNIVDAAMNQGVYDFLVLSAGYCHRQFGFVFLDLERDVPRLYQSPELNPKRDNVLQSNHRLYYLVRFAAVSYFSANEQSALFVALHNGKLSGAEIQKNLDTLCTAVDDELSRQQLPKEMVGTVLAINPDNQDDMIKLKMTVESFVKIRHKAMLNLKLSWIFLRSFLQENLKFSQMISVPLSQIQILAKEMQITNSEVEEFLQTYTEFGSLLHLKDILPNRIILQPAVFVNHLQSLYYLEDTKSNKYGIISMPDVNRALGEEAEKIVIPFITESGLGVKLDASDIFFPASVTSQRRRADSFSYFKSTELFLFIPSARRGEYESKKDLSSLYIVYRSKVSPPNMAGMFFKHLRKISTKLIPNTIRNSFSVKVKKEATLTVTFYEELIGLNLHPISKDMMEIWEEILSRCTVALNKIAVVFRDLTYKFALKCLDSEMDKFEYILDDAENPLCDKCRVFPKKGDARKRWHDAVKVVGGRLKEGKEIELLTLESLTEIAEKLSSNASGLRLDLNEKETLGDVLGIDEDEHRLIKSKYTGDQQILLMLLTWVTKIGTRNATKQNLFKILFLVKPSVVHLLHENTPT